MAKYIDNAIYKMELVINKGKPKSLKKELKARVMKPVTQEVPDIEREKICKKASDSANNAVSRIKKELSDKKREDLNFN